MNGSSGGEPATFYRRRGKRLLDAGLGGLGLVLLLPVLAVVAFLTWKDLGFPILYRQQRPGRGGRPFRMLKFRTMRDALGADGKPLSDLQRLTPRGKLLRSLSLDELPELFNVVRGDMSLVGPRPLLMHYLALYTPYQNRRHEAPPGITGWAQVNGRNALTWEEKFAFDVWYVDHQSFLLDLRILLMTLVKVARREDISHAGEATMSEFMGSKR